MFSFSSHYLYHSCLDLAVSVYGFRDETFELMLPLAVRKGISKQELW